MQDCTISEMLPYFYAVLAAGKPFWLMPFISARRTKGPVKEVDRPARWGILLAGIA